MLFPGHGCKVINELSLADLFVNETKSNLKMVLPEHQLELMRIASLGGKRCTFGGFLENRTHLWNGLYTVGKKEQLVHLGLDINHLPVGQKVASLTDGRIIHILKDFSSQTGWGGRVLIQTFSKPPLYIMYAHLSENLPSVGTLVSAGSVIGFIGDPKINGGWFPHLHLQVMTEKYMKSYMKNLDHIDGYARVPLSLSPAQIQNILEKQGLINPIMLVANL
jgi:murein DD-endopeptidase MepM/ murein hydrolase activator NlpD